MEEVSLDITEYVTNRYYARLNKEQIDRVIETEEIFKLDGTRPTADEVIALANGDLERDIEITHLNRAEHEMLWEFFYEYLTDAAYDDGADASVDDSDLKISVD